ANAADALEKSLRSDKDLIKRVRQVMNNDQPQPGDASHDINKLSLDDPQQWSIGWSAMRNTYNTGMSHLDHWASSLTDYEAATEQFWQTISTHGLAFNLLFLQKVMPTHIADLKSKFESAWTSEMDNLAEEGLLYFIDLSIFTMVEPQEANGATRFTPATVTLLQQDPITKALSPIAIRVSGYENSGLQVYTHPSSGKTTASAWLYALQAAKASTTVYGIWLGHVYHWHIVTAAMLMTLGETVPDGHPLHQLLDPHSNHLTEFNTILLVLWKIVSPPTSIASTPQFLALANTFAANQPYFSADPLVVLERNNIHEADFTEKEAWDRYPIVKDYLAVWQIASNYVSAFVDETYSDDAAIANDQPLQDWIAASGDPQSGNVKGLPTMANKQALKEVLTSLIYRITIHGAARVNKTLQPVNTFVANYPSTLQRDDIPHPTDDFDTQELLKYLHNTGTIGEMLEFYFVFSFTTPKETHIPRDGVESDLFFVDGSPQNEALINFRHDMIRFMQGYDDESVYDENDPLLHRW
ncbi:MAG: lipoxygenase family protein, partial [Chloroflexota bacterium]